MKRSLRALFLTCLTAALLTVTALADSGPKPQLTVKVKNAPEGLYYMDLLAEGPSYDERYRTEEDFAALDQDLLQAMRAAVPEGWHACILDGDLIFGQLAGTPGDGFTLHTFSYYGVPGTYRILIAAQSGEVWVSDACTREVLQSSVTLDWADKSISIPSVRTGYLLQFLSTFLPTILVEGALLVLFGYGRSRRNWLWFLVVNLITQGGLAWFTAVSALRHGPSGGAFLVVECVIALAEGCLYIYLLKGHSRPRAFVYGIAANVCSGLLGLVLVEPVWRFIVSIS